MLTITLGEKTYTAPYVTALALREIDRPLAIINRGPDDVNKAQYRQDLDTLVNWFCLCFGEQFTADEVYRLYPADRLLYDITLCVLAVQQNVSAALTQFPTTPAAGRTETSRA